MLKLSHIAIACPDMKKVLQRLEKINLKASEFMEVESEKVRVAMIPVETSENLRLEILEPSGEDSPIFKFLEKKKEGGLHHLSFEIDDIERWKKVLVDSGFEVIPPGIRKGARGKALFIHPRSMGGVLVELEELHS